MTEEEKLPAPQELQSEPPPMVEQESLEEKTEERETAAKEEPGNHLAEKRGRLVMAGLLGAVVLSLVAILVAGIFQLTTRWLVRCPADLSVNDPAPVLWRAIESGQEATASLGVPKELADQVSWRGPPSSGQ
ncbi:MAG: hypothetical protein FJY85_12110 [Deltaproteobacteria bacterium]|nr:hypothetical protein [Deltaproteobacteria bacterium]